MTEKERAKLLAYLKKKFNTDNLELNDGQASDCIEVVLNTEFFGTLYRDDDAGEISYSLSLSILESDL
ncbi:MAG: DUF3126 family protein [Alphaproteobacteria bacterium]